MRIVAGIYRRRPIAAPAGTDTRPTSDRLRETLFNVLAADPGAPPLEDSVWVDAFAGSGAVGIEALSRGARTVYFIESQKKAAQTIRGNLLALRIDEGFEVQEREVSASLRLFDSQGIFVDYCFLDPPYAARGAYAQVLGFLSHSCMLHERSIVVAEHDKHYDPGEVFGSLRRSRKLRQGDAVLSFYRRN